MSAETKPDDVLAEALWDAEKGPRDGEWADQDPALHVMFRRKARVWSGILLAVGYISPAQHAAMLTRAEARAKVRAEQQAAAIEAVLQTSADECRVVGWGSCTALIGGTFPNGFEWTEEMCCLPCRVRAALAPGATDAHDRRVRAEALREAADAFGPNHGVRHWLRGRADREEAGA